MAEIELHPGTGFCSTDELNRIARQQGLSAVIAKASIFDDICRAITLPESVETTLVQTFLDQEDIVDESSLQTYLELRGWHADDLLYVATKAERIHRFQQRMFTQDVELNYLGRKLDLDQVSYSLIQTPDADLAFELHQRLQEGEESFDGLITTEPSLAGAVSVAHVGPQAINAAPASLVHTLRVSEQGQLWPPFFAMDQWLILRLNHRDNAPLDATTHEQLLDELFDQWLNERISQLMTGEQPAALPLHLLETTTDSASIESTELPETNEAPELHESNLESHDVDEGDNNPPDPQEQRRRQETERWLQPAQAPDQPEDVVLAWQARIRQSLAEQEDSAAAAISLKQINGILSDLFPDPASISPRLQTFENVLWIRSAGGLFDQQTGLAIPGSFMCRFPRQRQHPHLDRVWTELMRPVSAYPRLSDCIFIPFANGRNFGHFATETLGHLWPFLEEAAELLSHRPVLLHDGTPDDLFAAIIESIVLEHHCSPLYDRYLPEALHLERVIVPEPSLALQTFVGHGHTQAAQSLGDRIITHSNSKADIPNGIRDKVYISRSALPSNVRRIHGEEAVEAHLHEQGWSVFHPQQHPLAVQIAVYRQARAIAGFEGSAMHGLTFLGSVDPGVSVLFLGDVPSVDYFLQFQAQGFDGSFIACTDVDADDPNPPHLKARRLRLEPQELALKMESLI